MIPGAPKDALAMIGACLRFRPSSRIKAVKALEYAYVEEFHSEFGHQETICKIGEMQLPLDDNKKYTKEEYRSQLLH